jgi:hypothetical protein
MKLLTESAFALVIIQFTSDIKRGWYNADILILVLGHIEPQIKGIAFCLIGDIPMC